MNKIIEIILNLIPVLLMIFLIPFVENDYILTMIFISIIGISLLVKYEKKDYIFLILGFCIMIIAEYIFISTGVETFNRKTLLGLMPLWLPVLWSYGFVAIKRTINILK
jgi:hypothetical protein